MPPAPSWLNWGIFAAAGELDGQGRRQRAAPGQQRLGAPFADRRGRVGEGQGHEVAGGIALEQAVLDVEAVERALDRDLPVGRAAAPAILGAGDRLGLVAVLGEALADRRAGVGEGLDEGLAERRMGEAVQADQLEATAAQAEIIVAAELVIPAPHPLLDVADTVGLARARALRDLLDVLVEDAAGGVEVEDRAV